MPIHRKRSNNKHEGEVQKLSTLLTFFLALIVFVLLVTVGGTVTYYALTLDLPGIDALKDYRPSIASRVYDENNALIDEFFLEDRKVVRIAEVPKIVCYAFVAAEDSRNVKKCWSRAYRPGWQHHYAAGSQDDVPFAGKKIHT
jgi:penicillin-binding protein 1A